MLNRTQTANAAAAAITAFHKADAGSTVKNLFHWRELSRAYGDVECALKELVGLDLEFCDMDARECAVYAELFQICGTHSSIGRDNQIACLTQAVSLCGYAIIRWYPQGRGCRGDYYELSLRVTRITAEALYKELAQPGYNPLDLQEGLTQYVIPYLSRVVHPELLKPLALRTQRACRLVGISVKDPGYKELVEFVYA